MGVSPSGVDDTHRQQILDQLDPDMFYVFMIWNKSLAVHALVYDMSRNILYENNDVEVKLLGGEGLDAFLADAKSKVKKTGHKKGKRGTKDRSANPLGIEDDFDEFENYRQYSLYGAYGYGRYGGYG